MSIWYQKLGWTLYKNSRTDLMMTRALQVDLCWIVTQTACKVECFDEFRSILLAMCWVKQNIARKIAARPMFLSISVCLCQNQPCSANTTLSENKLHALSDFFSDENIFPLYICERWLAAFAAWWWCGVCFSVSVENLGPLKQVRSSRAKSNRFHKLMAKKVRNVSE